MPLTSERLYPAYKIAALTKLLSEEGAPAEAVLYGTGLESDGLSDVATLTSVDQLIRVCRNALRLSRNPALPFRAGARLHPSDYGVVGLLLLSCESVRDVFRLAVKYQVLATPVVPIDTDEHGADALWIIPDGPAGDLPDDVRTFLIEQQFAQQVTLLDDVLGAPCRPTLACLAYAAPPHWKLYSEFLRCPCVFDWHRSEIRYPKDILTRRPCLANPLAATALQSTCDRQVADIESSLGFAGKVYRALRRMRDPGAGMKAVATALNMTDRTLRRRLADEGTSFSTIADSVKYGVATRHLKDSAASIEQISAMAGFSDPANFRRAFIRWTSMSPAEFRRLQRRRAPQRTAPRAVRHLQDEGWLPNLSLP